MAAVAPAPDPNLELQTLRGQLGDADREIKTRIEAAQILLARATPEADAIVLAFLNESKNPAAQMAVAEAIANRKDDREAFSKPLLAMLTGTEPTVRASAARALAAGRNRSTLGKLTALALEAKHDPAVRLVVVQALQRVPEREAVETLVRLLRDGDDALRSAAADSLAKLTNLRSYGADPQAWDAWWAKHKDKKPLEWYSTLAEGLIQSNSVLETENVRLRERLGKAMTDLYAATFPAQRDEMLLRLLKDPLVDVRLAATTITAKRLDAEGTLPEEIRAQVRLLLLDEDPEVRKSAAMLTAHLSDPGALDTLLECLKTEELPTVRQGLLRAMGQMRDPKAVPAIIEWIRQRQYEAVSASAASALVRIVEKQPLEGQLRSQAIAALMERMSQPPTNNDDDVLLREALLTAMGAVKDKAFLPALQAGLGDASATVRLAAANAIVQFGNEAFAAYLAPLADDSDRGVRQAAINGLGAIGGKAYLFTILQHAHEGAEADATVRQQAWDVTLTILARADAQTIQSVRKELDDRKDSLDRRLAVAALLVKVKRAPGSSDLPAVLRDYGQMLVQAHRNAEAAPLLAEAYAALNSQKDPQAPDLWREWTDCLLSCGDPGIGKVLCDQKDPAAFAECLDRLQRHLASARGQRAWAVALALAEAANKDLAPRLTADQRARFAALLTEIRAEAAVAEDAKVKQLIEQLSAEPTSRAATESALQAIGPSAIGPLLDKLADVLSKDPLDAAAENSIVSILRQIAPSMTGYDPAAPLAERVKLVNSWRQNPTTRP